MKILATHIIIVFLIIGCQAQNKATHIEAFKTTDAELHRIYQEYYKNRLEYGHEKDSLLPIFEHKLQETLGKKEFYGMSFKALTKSKQVSVITSKDNKLRIYSWNTYNMGAWKVYNSMYQYNNNGKLYTGILSQKGENGDAINFSDGYHFKIYDIDANTYLVKGSGTHGQGHEFYTMRLMHFETDALQDCNACFNGENQLVLIKPIGVKNTIEYSPETKEISYLHYLEDADTGFMKPTGKTITLIYSKGRFIKK